MCVRSYRTVLSRPVTTFEIGTWSTPRSDDKAVGSTTTKAAGTTQEQWPGRSSERAWCPLRHAPPTTEYHLLPGDGRYHDKLGAHETCARHTGQHFKRIGARHVSGEALPVTDVVKLEKLPVENVTGGIAITRIGCIITCSHRVRSLTVKGGVTRHERGARS